MKFFRRGDKEKKTESEGELRRDPEFMAFLDIVGIKIPGYNAPYKGESHTSSVKENENAKNPAGSGERREGNMKTPENRDEILLEILKELRELNSNVKALIVKADIGRQEIRELAENIYEKLDDIYSSG